jgi:folate-dependent tRNA-U54 methylase TrmFO/GidA
LPALETRVRDRKERHQKQCEIALCAFQEWMTELGTVAVNP